MDIADFALRGFALPPVLALMKGAEAFVFVDFRDNLAGGGLHATDIGEAVGIVDNSGKIECVERLRQLRLNGKSVTSDPQGRYRWLYGVL